MKVSAYGAHAKPNKILAAFATEPSAIKQYAQRTDNDIRLKKKPRSVNEELQAISTGSLKSFPALVLLCFQFKHCTRVPVRKPDKALCCDEHLFFTLLKVHGWHRKFSKQKPTDRIC